MQTGAEKQMVQRGISKVYKHQDVRIERSRVMKRAKYKSERWREREGDTHTKGEKDWYTYLAHVLIIVLGVESKEGVNFFSPGITYNNKRTEYNLCSP